MKNNSSVWMAVLTFTALVLGVIYLATPPLPAQAAMLNVQAGFSLMTAGTPGGDEALIVVDKSSNKLLIYHLNGQNLEVLAGTNYAK